MKQLRGKPPECSRSLRGGPYCLITFSLSQTATKHTTSHKYADPQAADTHRHSTRNVRPPIEAHTHTLKHTPTHNSHAPLFCPWTRCATLSSPVRLKTEHNFVVCHLTSVASVPSPHTPTPLTPVHIMNAHAAMLALAMWSPATKPNAFATPAAAAARFLPRAHAAQHRTLLTTVAAAALVALVVVLVVVAACRQAAAEFVQALTASFTRIFHGTPCEQHHTARMPTDCRNTRINVWLAPN